MFAVHGRVIFAMTFASLLPALSAVYLPPHTWASTSNQSVQRSTMSSVMSSKPAAALPRGQDEIAVHLQVCRGDHLRSEPP